MLRSCESMKVKINNYIHVNSETKMKQNTTILYKINN